jgi:glycosyltransferase involved in cell wall biosynthesis
MNILIINSNNPFQASGLVGYDFYREFRNRGHNVRMLVNTYDSQYPDDIVSMETPYIIERDKFFRRIKKRIRLKKPAETNPDYHFHELKEQKLFFRTKKLLKAAVVKPDAIFVLFAKDFINSRNIYELWQTTGARIFWLFYDMGPFTGGCHYAWDCKGYTDVCGSCPGLYSSDPSDISNKNLLYKKKYIDMTDIQVISASEWQYRQVKASSLFRNKTIHKILLSVDPAVFRPVPKADIREKSGIPTDKKVIFFGSVYMSHRRKGMTYLLESLKLLHARLANSDLEEKILLLIAGREIEGIKDQLPFDFHFMGYVDNTFGIASAFQAADIFLCPSIEDSGPSMINQSIMCGTPVVSFEMGVSLDLVRSGETGYLARLKDVDDMAKGLYNILALDDGKYMEMSEKCRSLALELCSPEIQIEQLEKVIHNDNLS